MYFPTTQWTLLARASFDGESAARQALEELCRRYWSPLYQFIRARGYQASDAEDLTQKFVLHLLEHSTLAKADRLRGRFRSFLLGALVRFLADEYDRRRAQKRGRGAVHVSLEEDLTDEARSSDAAGFDREWALVVLENAFRALRAEYETGTAAERFGVLRSFLPGSLQVPGYDEAAARLGLTVPAFKSELHRVRQRFKARVRQEIANTVSAPHEIDEEMNYFQRILMDRANDLGGSVKPLPADS